MAYAPFHAERLINKLIPFTESQRLAIETVQDQLWQLYQQLKTYKTLTSEQQLQQKAILEARFDKIFRSSTSFETLNKRAWETLSTKSRVIKSFVQTRFATSQ